MLVVKYLCDSERLYSIYLTNLIKGILDESARFITVCMHSTFGAILNCCGAIHYGVNECMFVCRRV